MQHRPLCVHSPAGSTFLRVGRRLESVTSNRKCDSTSIEEPACLISSRSDLKRQSLRRFWRRSPNKKKNNDKMSSDMESAQMTFKMAFGSLEVLEEHFFLLATPLVTGVCCDAVFSLTGCVVSGVTYSHGDSWRTAEEPCIVCRCQVCLWTCYLVLFCIFGCINVAKSKIQKSQQISVFTTRNVLY